MRSDARLGLLRETRWGTWISGPLSLPLFAGAAVEIELEEGISHPAPPGVQRAIDAFLALQPNVLLEPAVLSDLTQNYDENQPYWCPEGLSITSSADLWHHVKPISASVRSDEDEATAHVIVWCDCEWEQEHGLQLVFRDGRALSRISQCDDSLTDVRTDEEAASEPQTKGPSQPRLPFD